MSAIVRLLADLGREVTFASDSEERMPKYEEDVRRHASCVLYGKEQVVEHLRLEGGSYRYALLSRPGAHRYFAAVRAYAPNAKLVYDTVDLHWVRLTRAAEVSGDSATMEYARRFRNIEKTCAATSDLVLAITREEGDSIAREVPSARVAILPNIHATRTSVAGPEGRKGLFFIGGFEHQPNIDAVQWFVKEVLPRVREAIPGVVFHVVGSKPPDEVMSLAGDAVNVVGYVPNPDPYFDGSRVFVSPLRYGAGMKGKIGQAMTYGLPVVTTSVGSEGLRLVDGENALVADEPAAFADAVIRVYRDEALWRSLSKNSRRHIEDNFSETAVRPLLAELFPVATSEPASSAG
jgi:glycosyltransferase involved in cell wall biosynthesis